MSVTTLGEEMDLPVMLDGLEQCVAETRGGEMTVTVDTSSPGEGEDVAACQLSRRSCRPSLAPL